MLNAILYQLTKSIHNQETLDTNLKLPTIIPIVQTNNIEISEIMLFLHEDMLAEKKTQKLYETLLMNIQNPEVRDPIAFLRQRETVHYQRLGEAIQLIQERIEQ